MFATVMLLTLVNSVSGTPYITGGDSPRGTDCSGLVSWVSNIATGRPIYGDRFNTGNIEKALLARGFQYGSQPGALNVGWNGGHTAATLPDGTPVCAGEGVGCLPMPAEEAPPAPDPMMPFMPPPPEVVPPPAPDARGRWISPSRPDPARSVTVKPSANVTTVIVLMPPSETKHVGGDGPPLRVAALSSPQLGPLRDVLIDELVELAGDQSACRRALGISASQDAEIERKTPNVTAKTRWAPPWCSAGCAILRSAATLPAISRYTGVLYDALDIGSLRGAAAARARARLAVAPPCSACCAQTIRCPPIGSPRRRSCPDNPPWLRDGGLCSNRCWRKSRRVNWSSICDPVPTRHSEGCQARSRSRCWQSMPTAGAPW